MIQVKGLAFVIPRGLQVRLYRFVLRLRTFVSGVSDALFVSHAHHRQKRFSIDDDDFDGDWIYGVS